MQICFWDVSIRNSLPSNQINFDGTFTAITQHDGKCLAVDGFPLNDGNFLAVDGNSNFDGKSPLYRDRPPVRYIYVGKITEHLPDFFGEQEGMCTTDRLHRGKESLLLRSLGRSCHEIVV